MSEAVGTENIAVTRFREYLRIDTSQPTPDYAAARTFYEAYAKELGLEFQSVTLDPERSVDIITWRGTDPVAKSIMLYCHTDVVPVFPERWTYPPFDAHKDDDGKIFARGAQDMKCLGVQYLEAIRKLQSQNKQFKRNIHVVFGPDEEIGGVKGMKAFVETEEFRNLNVGFGLDEGIASPEDVFRVFYGERATWWFEVTCIGQTGHASQFLENTVGEKLNKFLTRILDLRTQEEAKLKKSDKMTLGDVTTVNFTSVKGGVQLNVVPDKMVLGFDMRVPPTVDLIQLENTLNKWCKEAGPDVSLNFLLRPDHTPVTKTDDSNPWWNAFKGACNEANIEINSEIFPAGTDARFVRSKGIPVIGFSPMNRTPILLHDHNEYLREDVFLRGIDIYCRIIPAIASVEV